MSDPTPPLADAEREAVRLTNSEKEVVRRWLYAYNDGEGDGLGGLWAMVEGIFAFRERDLNQALADYVRWGDAVTAERDAARAELARLRDRIKSEVFSENTSAVLYGVTGTPESYGGVTKDEALECASDLIERVRAALAQPGGAA